MVSLSLPKLRDPQGGWKNFAAIFYSLSANVIGWWCLSQYYHYKNHNIVAFVFFLVTGIFLSFHGRVIASYLVHESAHASIFLDPTANRDMGTTCLWLAGVPYADFAHVKAMHISHHKDRSDAVEFDYRTFCQTWPWLRNVILALEFLYIPVVEIIMHLRTAWYPILWPSDPWVTPSRWQNAWIGTTATCAFYAVLLWPALGGGWPTFSAHLVAGALVLHFLAMNDAFQHTYEAVLRQDHVPGPGNRTAQYEEENTYSTVLSLQYPWLNLLALNFGYHNAHHTKAITPWYKLPQLHDDLYGSQSQTHEQILPFGQLWLPWYRHRLRRVLEEDYGVVHSAKEPHRARDFIGSLGVSFLTV